MPIAARRAESNKGPVIFALDRNRKACEGFYIAPNNEADPPSGGQRPSGPNHHPKLGGADGRQRLDHSLSRKSLKRLGRIVARIDAISALMKVAGSKAFGFWSYRKPVPRSAQLSSRFDERFPVQIGVTHE